MRRVLATVVAATVVVAAAADAAAARSVAGPKRVAPGDVVKFRATGFEPNTKLWLLLQPTRFRGSNGGSATIERERFVTDASGRMTARFKWPRRYQESFCPDPRAPSCDKLRWRRGERVDVNVCGDGFTCGRKVVRIVKRKAGKRRKARIKRPKVLRPGRRTTLVAAGLPRNIEFFIKVQHKPRPKLQSLDGRNLWQPNFRTDARGRAKVRFKLPKTRLLCGANCGASRPWKRGSRVDIDITVAGGRSIAHRVSRIAGRRAGRASDAGVPATASAKRDRTWSPNRRLGPLKFGRFFRPERHGARIVKERRAEGSEVRFRKVRLRNGARVKYYESFRSEPYIAGVIDMWTRSRKLSFRGVRVGMKWRKARRRLNRHRRTFHYGGGPSGNMCGPLLVVDTSLNGAASQLYIRKRTGRVKIIGVAMAGEFWHGCPK